MGAVRKRGSGEEWESGENGVKASEIATSAAHALSHRRPNFTFDRRYDDASYSRAGGCLNPSRQADIPLGSAPSAAPSNSFLKHQPMNATSCGRTERKSRLPDYSLSIVELLAGGLHDCSSVDHRHSDATRSPRVR